MWLTVFGGVILIVIAVPPCIQCLYDLGIVEPRLNLSVKIGLHCGVISTVHSVAHTQHYTLFSES